VTVVGVEFEKSDDKNHESKLFYKPDCLYSVRVKKVIEDAWTPSFVSPLPAIGITSWETGTDYIVEMCKVSTAGGDPLPGSIQKFKVRDGVVENAT
jgi:hypothetical protein